MKKYISEFIGTCVLVLFGCGTAVVTGGDLVATALAFGLSIVAMAYVIGNVSGLSCCGGFCGLSLLGSGLLKLILINTNIGGAALGANGYGAASATEISLLGAIIVEVVLTFVFIYTILGVTSDEKKSSVAGIVIGLTLTFVHIIGIKLTGTSVNPARSLAPALLMGGEALKQVWVFILAPFAGSALAAVCYKFLNKAE